MSKSIQPVDDGIALLSVHDVCLTYEDDFIALYDRIRELGIDGFSVLVTPFHGMKLAKRIDKGGMFIDFLKSLGLELSLHGYYHQSKSGNIDEFRGLPADRIRSRILSGVSLLERTFGKKPHGFIPPSWSGPRKIADICLDLGLSYCVLGNQIHNLRTRATLATTGSLISEGEGGLHVGEAMLEMEIGGPLQVALHPRDHRHKQPFEILTDLKDRLEYRFTGYTDIVRSKAETRP